jgi:serine/threonine protein kinase
VSLAAGSRLGPYEILSPLGAGGMGEVYRARDTRLKRDVAVKTLSEELSRDAEHLDRFEREAQMLAAVNHPGIAAKTSRTLDPSGEKEMWDCGSRRSIPGSGRAHRLPGLVPRREMGALRPFPSAGWRRVADGAVRVATSPL